MAAFGYTDPQSVFDYGGSDGGALDPVDESALMADLVTAMSRAVDRYCNQVFYQQTYSGVTQRALIDSDGVLTCYLAVPTVSGAVSGSWRVGGTGSGWNALAGSFDVEQRTDGCIARALDGNYRTYRGRRVSVQLSYTGGWANLAAVPADFEWAMRRVCWWAYKKREAPMEKTADLATGMVFVPSSWPKDIREMFKSYVWNVPI